MRHRIVHDYTNVEDILWTVHTNDPPSLVDQLSGVDP
jgi:hypothetical protein